MTNFSVDTELMLDGEALSVEAIDLSPGQIERAVQLSQTATDNTQQWQVYLNALALLGFEQWLRDRAPDITIDDERCSLFQPSVDLSEAVYNLEIGGFKVCLIVTASLSDTVVAVPTAAIASPDAAQLYVVVEIQEEQNQVLVKAHLRSDQLVQQQHTHALQPDDNTYLLPLSWFEGDRDDLLLYLRCLEPASLPLGIMPAPQQAASAETTTAPASSVESAPQPTQRQTFSPLNAALWLRDQLDAVAQELAWVLLPPPAASAMRSSTTLNSELATDQFERLVLELERAGVDIPPEARGAYRNLQWGSMNLRLYALTWALPLTTNSPEWSLLLIVGTPSGDRIPPGIRLQIQDEEQVLIERVATPNNQDVYLYARVIGNWSEQFWATLDMSNGAIVTLPPFSFNP